MEKWNIRLSLLAFLVVLCAGCSSTPKPAPVHEAPISTVNTVTPPVVAMNPTHSDSLNLGASSAGRAR